MNSIILVGNKTEADLYVETFISTHSIKPYYIERFSETLKISHVRELKKKLSIKLGQSEIRLFIIDGDITAEAQNALLKVFEESPAWAFFILVVSSAQDVLPTVSSRCQLVFLENQSVANNIDTDFKDLGQNSYALLYPIFEKFHFFATLDDVEEFIRSFRNYIHRSVMNGQEVSPLLVSRFTNLCEQYPLMKSNNINRRSAIETAIITSFI